MLESSVWKRGVRGTVLRLGLIVLVAIVAAVPILQGAPPVFGDENEVIVTTGEELDAAIKAVQPDTVIKLANDIDAITSATYNVAASTAFTIDGAGHTIDGKAQAMTAVRIRAAGGVTVRNLTFRNLRSSLRFGGGALGVYRSHLVVENCAFIGNRHEGDISTSLTNGGGALLAHSASYQFALTNSTFYDNYTTAAGGAVSARNNPSVINGVTVINNTSAGGNGGGINSSGKVITLKNSIVAGNKVGVEPTIVDNDVRNPVDGGHNLIGSAVEFAKVDSTTTDCILGTLGLSTGAPQAVRNFGGSPYVIKITSPSSPALGNAGNDAPAADQRGQARDNAPDIGAFEYARVNVQFTEFLQGLVAEGEALIEERYEAAWWTVFAEALATVKVIANNPENWTDDEAQTAATNLIVALQNLYQHMTVDRSLLRGVITAAEQLLEKPDKYITVSVQNLQTKLEEARTIRDKADATQEELDQAYQSVVTALANLFEKGDKKALNALIGLSALYQEANYTPSTWQTFRTALAEAQVVQADPEAIKEVVDAAVTKLSDAMKNLARKAELTALKASISAAQNIEDNIDDYLASTVIGLPAELASAKLVRDNPDTTQAQANAATTALNAKILAARLKADKSQLLTLFSQAETLNLNLYTDDSAGAVKSAMLMASSVLNKSDDKVTQQEVDSASGQLSSAIGALALIPQVKKNTSDVAKSGKTSVKQSVVSSGNTGSSTSGARTDAPAVAAPVAGASSANAAAVVPVSAGEVKSPSAAGQETGGQAATEQAPALADMQVPVQSAEENQSAAQTGWIIAFILLAAFAACGGIVAYRNSRRRDDENSF